MEDITGIILLNVLVLTLSTIAIKMFLRRRRRDREVEEANKERIRREKEAEARGLIERIQDLDWSELPKLRRRHQQVTTYSSGYTSRVESCVEELGWYQQPGKSAPCWLDLADREIQRRVQALLSAEDLFSLQIVAQAYDIDQAWEALGTTPEGVAWLEAGLRSTSRKHRARCHEVLYSYED